MSEAKPTIGKAIDQIVEALQSFESKDRKAIINTVCLHLQIDLVSSILENEPHSATSAPRTPATEIQSTRGMDREVDIKALKAQKNPNSARQMACLVAFYLQELAPKEEQKDSIGTTDLEKYFKQAGFKLPTKLEQVLVDAKHAGYFDSAKRGEYRLTRVGYNLVAHTMPSKEKA
jgi:hypothetical protein